MRFSICIPNFNYAQYLELTLESVLKQEHADFEICVADNNSTDGSQEVIRRFEGKYARIKSRFNPSNLGFSDNLLAVSQMAAGDWHILLSSDDLINPGALEVYERFIKTIGNAGRFAFSSACDLIDGHGKITGYVGPRSKMWFPADIDAELSKTLGYKVYRVSSADMMRRCLSTYYGFFNFAATCYSAKSYEAAGGYIGGRMYSPDKWFHWRLLSVVDEVFFIDAPLFSYRWHAQNQAALQQKSRALKYLVDEYRNVFETTAEMLHLASMTTEQMQRNFIEEVIVKQAFAALKRNQRPEARRILHFGMAAYPQLTWRSFYAWALWGSLLLGPLGTWIAKRLKPGF